jgi:hypothetical protein
MKKFKFEGGQLANLLAKLRSTNAVASPRINSKYHDATLLFKRFENAQVPTVIVSFSEEVCSVKEVNSAHAYGTPEFQIVEGEELKIVALYSGAITGKSEGGEAVSGPCTIVHGVVGFDEETLYKYLTAEGTLPKDHPFCNQQYYHYRYQQLHLMQ